MKVYIKNKVVSLGGSSVVLDENKNKIFSVKGKFFSITRKKKILDIHGNKLFTVRNRFLNFITHAAYIYDENNTKIAMVKDKINFRKDYYVVGYKDEIKVDGGFFSLTCQILKNGQVIGTIRRQITFVADSFELEADEQDIPFLISLVVAIDNIVDKIRDTN